MRDVRSMSMAKIRLVTRGNENQNVAYVIRPSLSMPWSWWSFWFPHVLTRSHVGAKSLVPKMPPGIRERPTKSKRDSSSTASTLTTSRGIAEADWHRSIVLTGIGRQSHPQRGAQPSVRFTRHSQQK